MRLEGIVKLFSRPFVVIDASVLVRFPLSLRSCDARVFKATQNKTKNTDPASSKSLDRFPITNSDSSRN